MNGQIKIISGEEFYNQLVEKLVTHYADAPNLTEIIKSLLVDGLPKFDFENLKTILPKYFVYFNPVFVDFGTIGTENYNYFWFVSGMEAMVVLKRYVLVVDTKEKGAKVGA
ncbi:MAG: hypothetical protein EKK57_09825 [Proteobacteria bacterium]|nr:MAG: hypothetical protein EKK57_09825 [Pseudomonadota bacterium]